jgi:hypothetical protein
MLYLRSFEDLYGVDGIVHAFPRGRLNLNEELMSVVPGYDTWIGLARVR